MPTLKTHVPIRNIRVTGGSAIHNDLNGTMVSYTGLVTIDGVPVYSPRQLRTRWVAAREVAMEKANDTERTDPAAHYAAKGKFAAYVQAIDVLDGWLDNPNHPLAGHPLSTLAEALKVMRTEAFKKISADAPPNERRGFKAATDTLARLINEVLETALHTWEED